MGPMWSVNTWPIFSPARWWWLVRCGGDFVVVKLWW